MKGKTQRSSLISRTPGKRKRTKKKQVPWFGGPLPSNRQVKSEDRFTRRPSTPTLSMTLGWTSWSGERKRETVP